MVWNNTKPNPKSFVRNPDGSGRVWSYQDCGDIECEDCYCIIEGKLNKQEQVLMLGYYNEKED